MVIIECEKCGKPYSEWAPACPYCEKEEFPSSDENIPQERKEPGPSHSRGPRHQVHWVVHVLLFFLLALSVMLNLYLVNRANNLESVIVQMERQEEKLLNIIEIEEP